MLDFLKLESLATVRLLLLHIFITNMPRFFSEGPDLREGLQKELYLGTPGLGSCAVSMLAW